MSEATATAKLTAEKSPRQSQRGAAFSTELEGVTSSTNPEGDAMLYTKQEGSAMQTAKQGGGAAS